MTLFGQAGLPPFWIMSSSLALQILTALSFTADPAGNLMSNSRTAFGWLLFAVLLGSVESVEKAMPADVPALLLVNFWVYVCWVSASAMAATASARTPTRAPTTSLRMLLLQKGILPGARAGAAGEGRETNGLQPAT